MSSIHGTLSDILFYYKEYEYESYSGYKYFCKWFYDEI